MRNFLTILFSFLAFSLFSQAECIDGLGHVKYRDLYSIRDTTGLTYSLDTTYVTTTIETVDYIDTFEWVVIPAGWDTLVWQCERCDSIQFDPSDTIRLVSRRFNDPDRPEANTVLDSFQIVTATGTYTRTVTVLTSSGTWTKPDSLLFLEVICIGGGGGGASGAKQASGVVSRGGGGGAAGTIAWGSFLSSDLEATEPYTVGSGGSGGASVTAKSTANAQGSTGNASFFGGTNLSTSLVYAKGGAGAPNTGSGASSSSSGDSKPKSNIPGLLGSNSSTSGGSAGAQALPQNTNINYNDIYGGGAGGGVSTANVANIGSSGAQYYNSSGTLSSDNKGAIGTNGTDGVDYYMDRLPYIFGLGHYEDINIGYGTPGGGGGSSVTGNAGKGGNGGNYGGAGGGGGAARDSTGNSGAGGNGGAGVIILIEHLITDAL